MYVVQELTSREALGGKGPQGELRIYVRPAAAQRSETMGGGLNFMISHGAVLVPVSTTIRPPVYKLQVFHHDCDCGVDLWRSNERLLSDHDMESHSAAFVGTG